MPIAGAVVIAADTEGRQQLAGLLDAEPGVEVSGVGPAGIALVFEIDSMEAMTNLSNKIAGRADVADLQLTCCNWEDLD